MRVLIVEDNGKLARFLHRAFTEEGHLADIVDRGETAIEQVRALAYDIVVLDWMLPDTDGLSVCRALRALPSAPPILMLTARAEVAERIAGLDAGADDYLTKPFDLGELLARARALHRRAPAKLGLIRVSGIEIDAMARTLKVDGVPVTLTPREFALMLHLVEHADRVVPRTELLFKVWGMTFDPGSNVIEVHIRNLREKLGARSGLIETVRGTGYKIRAAP